MVVIYYRKIDTLAYNDPPSAVLLISITSHALIGFPHMVSLEHLSGERSTIALVPYSSDT